MEYSALQGIDLIVQNIPENFSTTKLKINLEKVSGTGSIRKISQISQSIVKVTVEDVRAKKALLVQKEVNLKFGRVTYTLGIEDFSQKFSVDTSMNNDEYLYDAPDIQTKAIFRYLAHEGEHENAFRANMEVIGGEITSLTHEHVQVKAKNSRFRGQWTERCKQCIEHFIERYESWSKKIDNCTSQDSKYYLSLQIQYKGQCFVRWYQNSSTIIVTGLKTTVGEVKKKIESRSRGVSPEQHTVHAVRPHAIEYQGVKPAIMRFVFRNKEYHSQLERCLAEIALTKIEQDADKKLTVKISPINHVVAMLHMNHREFEKACRQKLEIFFSMFSAWKRTFDPDIVKDMRLKKPELFETVSDQNVFKIWHLDTGVVDITGKTPSVNHHKKLVEEEMEFFSAQRQLPRDTVKSSRMRRGSSGSYLPNEMSGPRNFEFNTEKIQPAVLRFVVNDPSSKQGLETCCGSMATVKIFNDKGQIKIQLKSKLKNPQWEDANATVERYLAGFCTKSAVHDRTKLENAQRTNGEVFKKGSGVYVQVFSDTNVVKVTGLRDAVHKRLNDIRDAVDYEENEEVLPADIYIAQRECRIWKKVENESGGRVTILPCPRESKIIYRGKATDINSAKLLLGKLSEELVSKEVEGLTSEQLAFLKHCQKAQRDSLITNENWLDPIYAEFRRCSISGSLAYRCDDVELVCGSKNEWEKGNKILRECIKEFVIDLNPSHLSSTAQQKVNRLPVYARHLARKVSVVCPKDCMQSMKSEILSIIEDMKVETKFHPMPVMMAKHIKKFCTIERARAIELCEGRSGLNVTMEKEDIDFVDMQFEDLKREIASVTEKLEGYNLHEYLSNEGRSFVSVIENETQCSVFLEPSHEKLGAVGVAVTCGDLLEQTCDAIVISTGTDVDFSGQVGQAFASKYGSVLQRIRSDLLHLVKDKVYIAETEGLLKWKYLFFIVTPSKNEDLIAALLALLHCAEQKHVRTIALPAIGTGNLGLSQSEVSSCMRCAFEQFGDETPSYLKHIQLVLYDYAQYVAFQELQSTHTKDARSTGVSATVYGTSEVLMPAKAKLRDLQERHVRSALIGFEELSHEKKVQITVICRTNNVLLKWQRDKCQIEGIIEDVRAAEEEIKKVVHMEFPSCWQPMVAGQKFIRVALDEHSTEYEDVKKKFLQSQPQYSQINKIERVQNPFLYKQFSVAKDHSQKLPENATVSVTKRLFHGTAPENVDKICASNFDRNFAGVNGTLYGKGVYFHKNSQYSVGYCRYGQMKHMFLADVITGTYTKGDPSYKAAPARDGSRILYDCVVDDTSNPSIFVVFPDSSAYPSYLITFV